jgi:general secretion pathway protein A
MYAQHYGLRKHPFGLTPDPSFLFLTEQHREALVGLTYAITQRKGYVTLTGEVGTGKTTLLSRVLQFLPPGKLQFSLVMNPTLTPSEFLELVLLDFGIQDIPESKARRIWVLQDLLLRGEKEGKVSALIVDEAHKLSPDVLEEIRLLGNFEENDRKMLQIVLAGQPELNALLRRTDMRQLKQRIAIRLLIKPLVGDEVVKYIRHRWLRAGGAELPFTSEALTRIAEASRGIPRVINSLCDTSLVSAFADRSERVKECHVREAVLDLDLGELAVESVQDEGSGITPRETNQVAPKAAGAPLLSRLRAEPDFSLPPSVVPPSKDFLSEAAKPSYPQPKHSFWSRYAGKLGFRTREGTT